MDKSISEYIYYTVCVGGNILQRVLFTLYTLVHTGRPMRSYGCVYGLL